MAPLSDTLNAIAMAARAERPVLRVDAVTIRRARTTLVRDFSWMHPAGRIAWVVGENGAGKSSLLRVLAGRARPTRGRVSLAAPERPAPRALYYHPDMRPPRHATVREWDRWARALLPPDGGVAPPRPLSPPGLSPAHRVDRLSTGQAKRLLLDTLLRQPAALLVLDEPFAHLSPDGRAILRDALVRRARTAVVVVATNRGVAPGADRDESRDPASGPVLEIDGEAVVHRSPGPAT